MTSTAYSISSLNNILLLNVAKLHLTKREVIFSEPKGNPPGTSIAPVNQSSSRGRYVGEVSVKYPKLGPFGPELPAIRDQKEAY